MTPDEVLACALPAWYYSFSKVTIKSVILPLPEEVLQYLQSNATLVLPLECDQDFHDSGMAGFLGDDDDEDEVEQPTFSEFSSQVRQAIDTFGGNVFCKLNWSSPKDAIWVTCDNSLKCSNLAEVYLLLKSSEFIRHDLTQPFKHCTSNVDDEDDLPTVNYALVLRKWQDINPSHEFRCFVKENQLFAVTQRDGTSFYKHVNTEKESILTDIRSFFQEKVQDQFSLHNYTFDIIREAKDRVKLLDFNPFGCTTDGVLFNWQELSSNENCGGNFVKDGISFRFVETNSGIQPNGLRQYSMPRDFVDLSTGQDPDKLIDFLKLQRRQQERLEEDSD